MRHNCCATKEAFNINYYNLRLAEVYAHEQENKTSTQDRNINVV